jgi:hypothetical protein
MELTPPKRAVMVVDKTRDTRSIKAAARIRLKEKSFDRIKAHAPVAGEGASQIRSKAA